MPYIPNEADAATFPRQAVPMGADLDNFLSAYNGYGVVDGCVITAGTGLSVSMAAGTQCRHDAWGTIAPVANSAIVAADAANPRLDAVVLTATGAFAIRAGVAAAAPVAPDLVANDALLALVYVPAAAITLTATNIRDKRLIVAPSGIVYLANPASNMLGVPTNLAVTPGLMVPANYLAAGQHYRLRAWGSYASPATPGTLTVRYLYGTTVLTSTGAVALTASQLNKPFAVEIDLSVISPTAVEVQGVLDINTSPILINRWPMGLVQAGSQSFATVTIASTTAQALTLDFTLSVGQNAFRWRTMTIEAF